MIIKYYLLLDNSNKIINFMTTKGNINFVKSKKCYSDLNEIKEVSKNIYYKYYKYYKLNKLTKNYESTKKRIPK